MMPEGSNGSAPHDTARKKVFRLGDDVRIKTGPLNQFTGRIEGINQARRLLKVKVSIFGRATPVKLDFSEVEKI